jgi:hypothetical protein
MCRHREEHIHLQWSRAVREAVSGRPHARLCAGNARSSSKPCRQVLMFSVTPGLGHCGDLQAAQVGAGILSQDGVLSMLPCLLPSLAVCRSMTGMAH